MIDLCLGSGYCLANHRTPKRRLLVSTTRKPLNFEKSLSDLEALVERMEEGDMSLEESLKAFENGIRLTQHCQQALTQAQQRVQMLIEQDGELRSIAFNDEAAADEPEDGQPE